MKVTKIYNGWVVEITNTVHGCLEVGGVCGREVLYGRRTLALMGIDFDADPHGPYTDHATNVEALIRRVKPDRVLKDGVVIA